MHAVLTWVNARKAGATLSRAAVTVANVPALKRKFRPLLRLRRARAGHAIKTMMTNKPHWEFCLCYRGEEFSHWEWRRHGGGQQMTSAGAFASLSECVQDAMKHGYTGGGTILPGIVGTRGQ